MQAGDMMQDLKTGFLLRASPRGQFYAQLLGSAASIFFAIGVCVYVCVCVCVCVCVSVGVRCECVCVWVCAVSECVCVRCE